MRTCLRYCHKSKWFSKAIRTSQIIDYCPLYGNNAYSINNDQCSPLFTCNSSILSIRVTRGSLYLLPGNWYNILLNPYERVVAIAILGAMRSSSRSLWLIVNEYVNNLCQNFSFLSDGWWCDVLLAYESVCLSCVQYSISSLHTLVLDSRRHHSDMVLAS